MGSLGVRLRQGWGQNLKGDIFGGITSSVVALPLALAFGVLSGAGAAAGLYSAIFCGIIAAIFGGSPAQITGPTGGMTVVLVAVYKELGIEGLFLAMFMAGLIQIALSVLKVGKYIHYIPHPVIAGFTNGIAILIFSQQFVHLKTGAGALNWYAIGIAVSVMALMWVWPKISKAVPGSLVALVLTTVLAALFLSGQVGVIGEIPTGLPRPHLGFFVSQWQNVLHVLKPAIMLALLGAIESLLSAVVVDELAGTRHQSNRELFGQGLANSVAALFGGIAGTGAIVRSAVNVRSGGRTPLSGALHGVIILLVTVALGKYAAAIPMATLAGILMMTAIGMVDWESITDLKRAPLADSAVMLVTAGLTVFTDLVTAVSVGVVLSMALFTGKMSQAPLSVRREGRLTVVALTGPLFFGMAKRFLDEVEGAGPSGTLAWDLSQVTSVDHTGAVVLRKAYRKATEQGCSVYVIGLQEPVRQVLEKFEVLAEMESSRLVRSLDDVPQESAPAPLTALKPNATTL
ncbi:MAG TPA: SulP family inorganic anion transporter [Symbiobacteriaceae bacterium]|jgi:SulP family sulfate permease|nr:SulP family inorganic anion transporter [Symbiobacteriaceae bacterium]